MRSMAWQKGERLCSISLDRVCLNNISGPRILFDTFNAIAGHMASKTYLLLLDALILFLQMLLTAVAYETSLLSKSPSDTSLIPPIPTSSPLLPSPSLSAPTDNPSTSSPPPINESQYIIDLRLAHILDRLKNPAPTISDQNPDEFLPFPNTTPWPLPASLRMLIRARAEVRRRAQTQAQAQIQDASNGETTRRIPGEMDTDDGG